MGSLLALADSQSVQTLAPGDVLIAQGETGGDLFVLEIGRLAVERDGVKIATVATPGALLGEMAVLLGSPSSATVRAESQTRMRVIRDARTVLENDPAMTFLIARLIASRLDVTSAFLVELTKQHSSKSEQGLLAKIISKLQLPADGNYVPLTRDDLFGNNNDDLVRNFPGG